MNRPFADLSFEDLEKYIAGCHKSRSYDSGFEAACCERNTRRDKPTRKPTHISGRRWFQKTYGNTYNSVTIHFDDGSSEYFPMDYGYGDYYLQRAEKWIKMHYYYPNPDQLQGTRFLREVCGITWDVSDVSRQKDL